MNDRKLIISSSVRTDGLSVPMDYSYMMNCLDDMKDQYAFLSVSYLGESILGKGIPVVTLGEGKKAMLYVGGQSGTENITSLMLLRWIAEYCVLYQNHGSVFGNSLHYLFNFRTIYVVPMLNPDGIAYQIHGVTEEHVLYERLRKMNGENSDFSAWCANARGVELSRNYAGDFARRKEQERREGIESGSPFGFSGEFPESEPEVGHFCNYLRFHDDIRFLLALSAGEHEVICQTVGNNASRSSQIADALGRAGGYTKRCLSQEMSENALLGWCAEELEIPAVSIRGGIGNTYTLKQDCFSDYARIRTALFTVPVLL